MSKILKITKDQIARAVETSRPYFELDIRTDYVPAPPCTTPCVCVNGTSEDTLAFMIGLAEVLVDDGEDGWEQAYDIARETHTRVVSGRVSITHWPNLVLADDEAKDEG